MSYIQNKSLSGVTMVLIYILSPHVMDKPYGEEVTLNLCTQGSVPALVPLQVTYHESK